VIELNRKILGIFVALMIVAMLAIPLAVAKPTNGPNKVAVKLQLQ